MSSAAVALAMPAELTASASGPSASSTAATAALTESGSVTSAETPTARSPIVGDGLARVVAVHAADGGAGLGQPERDLAPDAGGGAGHERHLVVKAKGRKHGSGVSPRRAGH